MLIYNHSVISTSFQLIYMEQQAVIKARQEKQSYICQNIDPNYFEEFHQFCSSYAGEIDIDKWPLVYVHELVAKFKEDLKKKNEQEDNHQRSFAIYQTTSGDNQVSGSSNLQMSQILSSFQQPQQPKPSPNQSSAKQPVKPSPQNDKGQTAFSKKQPSAATSPVSTNIKTISFPAMKEKRQQKKKSALQLLDSAFDEVNAAQRSKIQQNAQKMNKSFFDSVNFWEVPKLDDVPKLVKVEQAKETPAVQSPNKDFKSIKLNLNVGQLNQNANKSGSDKKNQQFATKNKNVQIQTFNYNQGNNNGDNFIKINAINAISSPSDIKSQFDTFSIIAEEQIQKKRSSTLAVIPDKDNNDNRKKSSTIKLKQVKDLKTSPSTSSKVSSMKQPYKGPRVFKTDFVDHVFCAKSSVRPNLSHQNLRIQIKNFDIIQRSIFSANYLMYNMKVLPMGVICKRNYEDFVKYRATLQKFYPGIQLPFLQKQGWRSDTSQQYAKKQIQMIEFFISDILRNKQLQNSRVTQQFLSIQDHKKMKRKFEEYDRMTKLKSIEQLCLLEGKVQVALTQQQRVYNENMAKLSTKLQANIEKYRKNCETLSNYYSQVMTTILVIDDIIKEMDKDVQQFNKNVYIKQIETFEASLKKMRDHYKQNYFRVKFEKNVIEDNILPFLRYEKQNVRSSKTIIELCNGMTSRYLKRCESENSTNLDSSYLNSALNQQKQGILQESKNILVLKYQAGYLQAQASSEMQRIMNGLGDKIGVLWKDIGSKYLDQLAKSVNIWSQIS